MNITFITPLEATDGGSDIIQPYPNWASILDPKRCQSELNVFSPQGGTKMNGCGQHTLTCFVSTFCWSDVQLVQWPRNPQGLIIDSSHVLLMLQTSGHLRFHLSNKKKQWPFRDVLLGYMKTKSCTEQNAKLYIRERISEWLLLRVFKAELEYCS